MCLNGAQAHHEMCCNLPVGGALRNQGGYLAFAGGQATKGLPSSAQRSERARTRQPSQRVGEEGVSQRFLRKLSRQFLNGGVGDGAGLVRFFLAARGAIEAAERGSCAPEQRAQSL